MAYRFSLSGKKGFQKKVVSPENSDLKFLSLSYLSDEKSTVLEEFTDREEWLWVLLSGKITIEVDNAIVAVMERRNVFDDKPVSLFIPSETNYTVRVNSLSEAIAVSSIAEKRSSLRSVPAEDVKIQRAGKLNYQRTIFNIIPQDFPASKIIAGETIHDTGHWSCFPPHKHDVDQMPEESKHEELYFLSVIQKKLVSG